MNSLIYRYSIINSVFLALTAWLLYQGFGMKVLDNDMTNMIKVICLVFAIGWLGTTKEIYVTNAFLNTRMKVNANALQFKLADIAWLSDTVTLLSWLGILGTVVGIMMVFGGIDVVAHNASTAAATSGDIVGGAQVALATTVLGSYFAIWQSINFRMVVTGIYNSSWVR